MGTRLEPAVAGILLFLLGLGLLSFGHREAAAVQTSVCWTCMRYDWGSGDIGAICSLWEWGWTHCHTSSRYDCHLSGDSPACNPS